MKNVFLVLLVILFVAIGWFILTQNHLAVLDEQVRLSLGEIETQLQRRNDLIPNLLATVKGYAEHEEKLFTEIADARTKLIGTIPTGNIEEINSANQVLEMALGRLLAISESYPDLKASEQFIGLQDELAGTENRIAYARNQYNEAVGRFNTAIRMFPASLVANSHGYHALPYFEAGRGAEEVPQVQF